MEGGACACWSLALELSFVWHCFFHSSRSAMSRGNVDSFSTRFALHLVSSLATSTFSGANAVCRLGGKRDFGEIAGPIYQTS
jgi:hypothetical protein